MPLDADEEFVKNQKGLSFPTSPHPPLDLVRPLAVFGESFRVELSTGITLSPDTVMRAALDKSFQTFLRENKLLLPLRELDYAVKGEHRLSTTTRVTILRMLGPMSDIARAVLDHEVTPDAIPVSTPWQEVAAGLGASSGTNAIDLIVQEFLRFDLLHESMCHLMGTGESDEAQEKFTESFGPAISHWRELCPTVGLRAMLLIETSLAVISNLERTSRKHADGDAEVKVVVCNLLDPKSKPVGNWLKQVGAEARCSNNRELSDTLARRAILYRKRPIGHDTLKGWSSMKRGMAMPLTACHALLAVVSAEDARNRLLTRFALARYLTFLCDLLRSSILDQPPGWPELQGILKVRYDAIIARPNG